MIRLKNTKTSFGISRTFAAAILLGFLSSCSTQPDVAPTSETLIHEPATINLFAKGYRQIADKYIEAIPVRQLALEGIKGLSSIDPEIVISKNRTQLTLSANDQPVKNFNTPNSEDEMAWATLTNAVWHEARKYSSSIHDAPAEQIYEAIFDGTLSTLDGFSRYAGKKQARRNRNRRDGFGGIGIRFHYRRGLIHVVRVLKNTPADTAGLKKGDIITHVGDVPLKGLKSRDIIAQLHGPIKSLVNITVQRTGRHRPLHFTLERSLIVPNTVKSRIKNGLIIVRIRGFNQKTSERTAQRILSARKTMGSRMKGVVLDLRGNPGGLLKQAIKVADLFLKKSSIVSTRGRHPDSYQYYEANFEDIINGLPLAVLIDGKSASAAEVLAAALQDSGRAVIIGTTSYGKGTVQSVIRLPNDGEITLTWSRLHSPAGYIFHNLGIFTSICTSGQNNKPAQVIRTALDQHAKVLSTYQAWWQSNKITNDKRNSLRETCPPERRKSNLEVDIATALLADKLLYARAMMDVPEMAHRPYRELSLQPSTP